ncbi:MAG: amino acid permease [Actinobacteria bacterium]|nr:MAG: amino acid permease [Actinomycetota bacterium]
MNEVEPPRLKRSLGLADAVGIGLGAIIGAGVFVAIAPAVGAAGSLALAGVVVAGLVALFNALSAAQLAAAYPVSGATYAYGRIVVSQFAGFISGWIFVFAAIAADSAISLTFATYLGFLLPAVPPRLFAVLLALAATGLNYWGLRYSARVNTVLVIAKVAVLGVFVAAGAFFFRPERLQLSPASIPDVLQAAAILFFAYTGYARIATLGEEVRDPERNIPRAILAALGLSGGLYLGVLLVALGLLGPARLAASAAPLASAAIVTGITPSAYLVAAGALLSTSTVLLTDLLGISRVVFAMARDGELPPWLAGLNRRSNPGRAILLSGAVVIVLAGLFPLTRLVEAGSFGLLVYYALTNLAAILLSEERRRYHRIWAAAGLVSCLGLALFLSPQTIVLGMLVIGLGALYFRVRRRLG